MTAINAEILKELIAKAEKAAASYREATRTLSFADAEQAARIVSEQHKLRAMLESDGARIGYGGSEGDTIRLGGVRAASTGGLPSALANWRRAALRRLGDLVLVAES